LDKFNVRVKIKNKEGKPSTDLSIYAYGSPEERNQKGKGD